MDTKQKYKLDDEQRQRTLASMAGDPLNLGDEIAVAKLLLSEALADKNPCLCNAIIQTIGKLTGQHLINLVRTRRMIAADDLRTFLASIGEAIVRRISHLPDHQAILDDIISDFESGLVELQKPTLRIGGPDV